MQRSNALAVDRLVQLVILYPLNVSMKLVDAIVLKSLFGQACCASFPMLSKCRATQLNHTLTALLRDLSKHVDSNDQKRIAEALDEVHFFWIAAFLARDCD